jgi:RND superfamily putative drug exporter
MERLPLFLLYITGVTLIVLAMAFRSIVISATAAITTILSAFVGFGVLTLVLQEGHLLGVTGLDRTGPIETFVPPIAFAILFGLFDGLHGLPDEPHPRGARPWPADGGGDGARHRRDRARGGRRGGDHGHGLRGLDPERRSNPERSSSCCSRSRSSRMLIMRMTLVRALLTLLRAKSWYIPRWLDRLLPNVTIEPTHDREAPLSPKAEPAEAAVQA